MRESYHNAATTVPRPFSTSHLSVVRHTMGFPIDYIQGQRWRSQSPFALPPPSQIPLILSDLEIVRRLVVGQ